MPRRRDSKFKENRDMFHSWSLRLLGFGCRVSRRNEDSRFWVEGLGFGVIPYNINQMLENVVVRFSASGNKRCKKIFLEPSESLQKAPGSLESTGVRLFGTRWTLVKPGARFLMKLKWSQVQKLLNLTLNPKS